MNAELATQIIQPERIGKGQSIPASFSRLMGVEDLVKDPGRNEQSEDAVLIGQADQNRKDQDVNQCLHKLAVIHGTHTRDEPQEGG
jgi:hypothetical protein